MSFKIEVQVVGDNSWATSGLRFSTAEECATWGEDLASRWVSVTQWRVSESSDEPNYRWSAEERRAVRIEAAAS